ncbi:MAG: nucleotide exchange factor GrpE [Rickettsia endosymbiont of Ixodes persulcatus]|nr:nucleotide exchange factor GrpE [Rickettsia endosymbiont of Ixodes persulcatus]MCZ6904005.1 nucleotide exchange factor GrpE [Rickettsia endosymbiont of Ixodes persulcatus]MCZ6909275.1 nucleotide exchange factor GrpE [Rickettsia endosymbiont of Ixodes persulcatus]MCZ6910339.1 nucleotide exchange factor GrpE [Rickettsia endosymbiont of Ixodes persulcatus]MCZ6913383.1 nucleotide exchange factor GrpE [Rickettsia endosymbiont of Ixodes persulcatus]
MTDNNIENNEEEIKEVLSADNNEEIIELKAQIEELKDKLIRTTAEIDNTRKRLEKARDEAKDYAIATFAKELLNVSDNLSRALEHKPANLDVEVTNIIAGVQMTKDELDKIFHKHHIEEIKPEIGSMFDYNLHNAISQIDNTEYAPNSVITLMQSGYKIKDRLLRPATVQVTKKPQQEE